VSAGRRPRSDVQVLLLALASGLPGTAAALFLAWSLPVPPAARWTLTLLVPVLWLGFAEAARRQFARPLQTLGNLIAALRAGDFTTRVTSAGPDDPLGLARLELNHLADRLSHLRLDELEAGALLREVLSNLDVAVLAVDHEGTVQFANRTAESLLGRRAGTLVGTSAGDAGIADLLEVETPATVDRTFPGGAGRWELRRGTFRQGGVPHQVLVLSDVGRVLRQEEREAWRRLIRVLSHEINNSLTPIQSISRSLLDMRVLETDSPEWDEDLEQGLTVIATRAEALGRFMSSYARLARVPPPRKRPVAIGEVVERAVRLGGGSATLRPGPRVTLAADPDQLEQVLINLLKNAVEASAETGGAVEVGWDASPRRVTVWIRDEGPGIGATGNLFVPFFTTKPSGSGIGLVLSRHIAEGHGGSVELADRTDRSGCEARLVLPRA
jgi:two-component system nitrogen regulation sensor histidine kinase NtrY